MEVFLCAGYDGEPLLLAQDGKTALYRSGWLKAEFPKCRATVEDVETKIRTTPRTKN
jgi:hypothetical protein